MIYCMSDLHGDWDRYDKMLEKIGFGEDDTMYIIGDVIDRHPDGIPILLDIMQRENMVLLIGNHEWMMLNEVLYDLPGATERWNRNGAQPTRDALNALPEAERHALLAWVEALPDQLEIAVNGRKFLLVHAFPAKERYDRIWDRSIQNQPEPPFSDCTVIIGHTPVQYVLNDWSKPARILHLPGIIDIDCGCAQSTDDRVLGCLRLDDMAEFYV